MSSVFGDLGNLGEDLLNTAEDAGSGLLHGAEGVGEMAAMTGDHLAATGAELLGQQDLRDDLDNSAVDHREAGFGDFGQAGNDFGNAVHDVVGGGDAGGGAGGQADDGSGYDQGGYDQGEN